MLAEGAFVGQVEQVIDLFRFAVKITDQIGPAVRCQPALVFEVPAERIGVNGHVKPVVLATVDLLPFATGLRIDQLSRTALEAGSRLFFLVNQPFGRQLLGEIVVAKVGGKMDGAPCHWLSSPTPCTRLARAAATAVFTS